VWEKAEEWVPYAKTLISSETWRLGLSLYDHSLFIIQHCHLATTIYPASCGNEHKGTDHRQAVGLLRINVAPGAAEHHHDLWCIAPSSALLARLPHT
jgi:hypothetical protein